MNHREAAAMAELRALCTSPGYVHALAYIVFRDNFVGYTEELERKHLLARYSPEKLIRSEMMTLAGLMVGKNIDQTLQSSQITQTYIEKTDELLLKLHHSLLPTREEMPANIGSIEEMGQFISGGIVMREAVFYAGESAYDFQYRELSPLKYRSDSSWLEEHRGFRMEDAVELAKFIGSLLEERLSNLAERFMSCHPDSWTLLPEFTFTPAELAQGSGLEAGKVQNVLQAFSLSREERNLGFTGLSELNLVNITPMIPLGNEKFVVFSTHSLLEAIYESPFYWLYKDDLYRNRAQANRGEFLEAFAEKCLTRCFGSARVYRNVLLTEEGSTKKLGEIDVLVVFGDRIIVLQAKTKRMTQEARKGNDRVIRDDFAKSVQNAYEQAYSCAEIIANRKHQATVNGDPLVLPDPKKIYLLCVVADHYPALSFQASQFLSRKEASEKITMPLVMDVFLLDVMTEMLASPLHLLSYIDRRVSYDDKIAAGHELVILAYHLKRNLWLEDDLDRLFIQDDISVDLDLAMLARRTGVPGAKLPPGILTKSLGSMYQRLIAQIEHNPHKGSLDLGMFLLQLAEETIDKFNQGVGIAVERYKRDGLGHDFVLGAGGCGIVIHIKTDRSDAARIALQAHVRLRKYKMKSPEWFGVCIDPRTLTLTFACLERRPWVHDNELDVASKSLRTDFRDHFEGKTVRRVKVGRNEPCPCGSKKKYKKCHGFN